jgi:hypothetical protein
LLTEQSPHRAGRCPRIYEICHLELRKWLALCKSSRVSTVTVRAVRSNRETTKRHSAPHRRPNGARLDPAVPCSSITAARDKPPAAADGREWGDAKGTSRGCLSRRRMLLDARESNVAWPFARAFHAASAKVRGGCAPTLDTLIPIYACFSPAARNCIESFTAVQNTSRDRNLPPWIPPRPMPLS